MFEQTLLTKPARTRRAWTVAVGFSGQVALIGAAVLMPLIHTDRLPPVQPLFHINVPPAPPKPGPEDAVQVVDVKWLSGERKPFIEPAVIPTGPPRMIVDPEPPALAHNPSPGVPNSPGPAGPGGWSGLETMIGPAQWITTLRPPAVEPAETKAKQPKLIRISKLDPAQLIHKVTPEYPAVARAAGISGLVRIEAIIGTDGSIRELRFVSGPPLLARAAIDAVRQWHYKPMVLNGEPTEVLTGIDVVFTLAR